MINSTAWQTSVGVNYKSSMDKIILKIKEAFIKEGIQHHSMGVTSLDKKYSVVFITGKYASESEIPNFNHPIVFEYENINYLITDVRPQVGIRDYNVVIKNQSDFELNRNRVVLNLIWLTNNPNALKSFSILPIAVYSNWISENLARVFALDPGDQAKLAIISALFYQSLFTEFSITSDKDVVKSAAAMVIKNATKLPPDMIFSVLDKIAVSELSLANISDLCEVIKLVLENDRLENINEGIIVSVLGNSWYGLNAKEVLATAIEHPPTWISVVYSALNEKSFKNSGIAKICERYRDNKGGSEFTRGLASIIGPYLITDGPNY